MIKSTYHSLARRLLLGAGLVACALSAAARDSQPATLQIEAGQQKVFLYAKGIHRIAVGDPEVANVTVTSEREVLVTAKKPGTTNFLLWHSEASAAPDITATILVTAAAGLAAHGLTELNPRGPSAAEAGPKVQIQGESPTLEAHAQARAALDEKASTFVDNSTLGFDAQVQIDIKIVEVSRGKLKSVGLFLGKDTDNSTLAVSTPGNLSGVSGVAGGLLSSSGFLPQLQAFNFVFGNGNRGILGAISVLEGNGFAYTLAEPSLTAMSGQSASFLAGGEFPIPIRSGSGGDSSVTITYKEFGVRLTLTPTVLDPKRIMIKVAPEVSEIDFSTAVETGGVRVPGLSVRRTDTSVALGDGETFVLSGLISRSTLSNVDKVPGLGDIPILGAFFRSTRFDRDDKELLMVVTPHLVRPMARQAQTPPLPGRGYRDYDPNFFGLWLHEKGDFGARRSGFSN